MQPPRVYMCNLEGAANAGSRTCFPKTVELLQKYARPHFQPYSNRQGRRHISCILKIIFQKRHISLHAYTILPFRPDGYRVSCSFKPTQSLHDAYISLHDFGVLQRGNENQLTHSQVLCFLQVKKFSREFCGIQVD